MGYKTTSTVHVVIHGVHVLVEYDMVYMTRKAVKGRVIANHLADNAIEDYKPLNFDFPDEDVLM
jgi:hypothetical protein